MTIYMVCDEDGYELTDGLQEQNAREVAQRMANERGESVWLSVSGSDGMGDEIVPVVNLEQAARECAEVAYREVTTDPAAYGIDEPWKSVQEWVDYELEGDDAHALARKCDVSYKTARAELIEALKWVSTLDGLNAPFEGQQ